jgi:hypothetical protein
VITRKRFTGVAVILAAAALSGSYALPVAAKPAPQDQESQQKKPSYTLPEYNAFQAANTEKDLQTRIKLLDDFVAKYPNSTLMPYVYTLYYQTYNQLKDYQHTVEYADKLVALGDKVDAGGRLQALQIRVQAFLAGYKTGGADAQDQLTKERDAALEGANLLDKYPKPDSFKGSDTDWANQKKPGLAFFYGAAGFADLNIKDNAAAITAFKNSLANKPEDPVSEYRLGLAYLQSTPPQYLDGFWALARAIDQKVPDSDRIKDYLQKQILAYEQPGCDSQATDQLNSLLQLAQNAPDRPATWTIPSQADLKQITQSANILSVIGDLSGGGDKAQKTWLAICNAEFPEVVGKIIDINKSDNYVDFMVYTGATADDMQKATTANMDVKVWTAAPPSGAEAGPSNTATEVPPQPDVTRLQKDDGIRFSGSIVSYDPSPFVLHWDQVKVDPSIIPEKGSTAKRGVPARKRPQQ